ncbi:MAG: restriction endonuclease subunit S [Chitinophagales bacterium]|jgi:type I restriction enzyme S subunit
MSEIKDIPKHWEIKKLGEVCDKLSLNKIKIKQKDYLQQGKFPVIDQGQELIGGFYNDEKFVVPNDPPYIIFGDHTKVKKFIPFKFIAGADGVKVLKSKSNTEPKFLYYAIQTIKIEDKGYARHFQLLEKSDFPLPPLSEQQAIVAKIEELLSELENGKQQLLTAQQQLKVYRQSLLKWAFEGKLTCLNLDSFDLHDTHDLNVREKNQGNQNNQKNQGSDKGELPEGWKWVKVSEISNVVRGGSPRPAGDRKYYDGNIPFLKVRDITKDSGTYLTSFEYTIKEAGLHKTRQIKPNTLLLSNSGATLGVPKICMIDATMNDGIAAFLDLDERSNLYLYYFWLSKTKELRNINMGAAQPNLNTDIIKNYLVPYCSIEEQQLIVSELESKLTVCDRIEETISQSLQQAETLRQSILKKAFEGKLA